MELFSIFLATCSGFILCYALTLYEEYKLPLCKVCKIKQVARSYETCFNCANKLINHYVIDKANYKSLMNLISSQKK